MKTKSMIPSPAGATVAIAALLAFPQTLSAATLWTAGHGDIGLGYEDEGDGPELHLHLHLGEGSPALVGGMPVEDQEFDAGDVSILGNNAVSVTSSDASLLAGIGTATGATIYLLPASGSAADAAGVPFMGWGSEELEVADWSNLSISLVSVSGPGDFSVYYFDTNVDDQFHFSTADGIDGSDVMPVVPGGHDHFNVAFTQPGIYQVTLTATGTHATDGLQTSTETFTFAVPEPSTALMAGLSGFGLLLRRRK